MTTPFDRNTTPERVGDLSFSFTFDNAFMGVGAMFGGLTIAASVRAAEAYVDDPEFRMRSVSVAFVAAIKPGSARAQIRELRRGGRVAHIGVSLFDSSDQLALECIVILARDREGFAYMDKKFPDVPPPEECPDFLSAPDGVDPAQAPIWAATPLWTALERRVAVGHHWWDKDWEPESSFGALWIRYRETPRLDDGTVNPLAVIALSDMAGQAISEKMGPTAPDWLLLSADHYARWLEPARSEWFLLTHGSPHASDGFASVGTDVWDSDGNLVSVGRQVSIITLL